MAARRDKIHSGISKIMATNLQNKLLKHKEYNSQLNNKELNKTMLKDIDLIVFDMQDAGIRHYTYITTLFETIDAASKNNKKIIVLDRPNLLGPIIEGPLVEKNFKG